MRNLLFILFLALLVGCQETPPPKPLPPVGIETGMRAPDFTLPSNEEGAVTLSSFRGQSNVVLYFYPKDDTPGCTLEACTFRDSRLEFDVAETKLIGISVDGLASHGAFAKKHNLRFTLLSDEAFKVTRLYAAERTIEHGGREVRFANRITFVIDKEGIIRKKYLHVDPRFHAKEVLHFVRTLQEP